MPMADSERNYQDECGDHGGTNRDGEPCGRPAGWGTDFDDGMCKHHRGTAPDGSTEDHGAPEGNGNAETHGLTADGRKWFERHRDEVEDEVRQLVESWVERAPFGWDAYGNVSLLVQCAIDEMRMRQANEYVDEEGIVVEHYDGHDPVSERAVIEKKENPALLPKSRMKKDTIRTLKDLGVLDDPESQKAQAEQDLVDVWRQDLQSES